MAPAALGEARYHDQDEMEDEDAQPGNANADGNQAEDQRRPLEVATLDGRYNQNDGDDDSGSGMNNDDEQDTADKDSKISPRLIEK